MSEQVPELKPETDEESEECYAYCIECGDPIWEDCFYCNGCAREYNEREDPDQYEYDDM